MSSNFAPTQAELSLVNTIFGQHDTQKLGILTGDVAVRVFGGAKLQPTTLGEIWSMADEENNGWLSKKGVSIALRLIGWAQKGEKINAELISKPGPLAVIDGISSVSTHTTGMSTPRSPPPVPNSNLPPLDPQDRAKFLNMFMNSGIKDGLLSSEQARDIFIKSRLSNEKLLQIWNLADTQDRGALDSTDFAIGMYFIQGIMSNQIPVLPTSLPPGLYQQASGGPASSIRSHATGNSGSFSPSATQTTFPQSPGYIQPQYTGQVLQPQGTGTLAHRVPSGAPTLPARKVPNAPSLGSSAFNTAPHWDVTGNEKAQSDGYFETLDTTKQGFIEGDIAVPFMLESKLPGEILAQVWDLADLNNDGRLTRDGFAVAMHLIQKKLAGGEIPTSLPPSLVPPSMRQVNAAVNPSPFSPLRQQISQATAPEPQKDLFSFDDSPPPSAAPSAGPFNIPMQTTGSQPQQSSAFASPSNFASPSAFASPISQDPFASSVSKDFLSDDDEHTNIAKSHPLEDQSAEIGNTQNQLHSTNKSLSTTKDERITVEQTLADQASQLSALQTQLSSSKAAYETEVKLLEALKERHATQTAEIGKSRTELITAESDLSALRVEKTEIEGTFLRDKEEVRELNRKAFEAGQQIEALKAEIEKAKKEAKQQKGLLAIAKKQLSSKEAERAKVEKELAEAQAAAVAATQGKEEVEVELERVSKSIPAAAQGTLSQPTLPERDTSEDSLAFAASHALPLTPEMSSPLGKSNNPFERLARSDSSAGPRAQSPFLPFSNVTVPSPSIPNSNAESNTESTINSDPFGFSQAFGTSADGANAPFVPDDADGLEFGARSSTPKLVPASPETLEHSPATPTTAHTEEFTTPPSTADAASPNRKSTEEMFHSGFPDLGDSTSVPISGVSESSRLSGEITTLENTHETDIGGPLKEIEPEESDSSDEEDEVPLATLKAKSPDSVEPTPTSATNGKASFDQVFGVSPANPQAALTEAKDAFGVSGTTDSASPFGLEATISLVSSPAEAGLNAFDEAMNKIPSNGSADTSVIAASTATPQFPAFDDNFDFGSVKTTDTTSAFPSAPNGSASAATDGSDGFESLFVTPPSQRKASAAARPVSSFLPNVGATPPTGPTIPPPAATGPSFDEVFAGFDAPGPAMELDTPTIQPASAAPQPNSTKTLSGYSLLPSQSSVVRSISPPPRQKSPPVRTGSPKPTGRPSTASSREGHEKEKNPPTRHSKLSIRLPFGKKKKQEAVPPPPPSQFLTPPVEEPERTNSPAVDDDVEAVKQLTAMGFSRTQAVAALEKYAYDVPRALNSLLGQP
ncbi:hypothetical protein D9757_001685 [Collybiopsis confluens]|uniref:Uncharacterized protein n=1 Tax=Collybiopsis confluens TaxID=2823264 RepID=A0A8H5MEW9_9AGAR|nr:hypothetical protein D9757_001685 [Collybiopsis confluens]